MLKVADKDEEMLKILDENGNETGDIKERGFAHANHLFHNEIALWIIDKDKKQVLVQRRSPLKKNAPNKIGICAGHVVNSETIEEALYKEANEELGLNLKNYNVFGILRTKGETAQNSCFTNHFGIFAYIPINQFRIQEEELSEVFYIDYEKFKNMIRNGDPEVAIKYTPDIDDLFEALDSIIGKEVSL